MLFASTIGYSRLILGAHGLNQILFGACIGIWVALTMHYVVRDTLINDHLAKVLDKTATAYSTYILNCAACFLVAYGVCLTAYYTLTFSNDPAWSTRIEAKCGAEELKDAFHVKSITEFGEIQLGFGLYTGFLYSVKWQSDLASCTSFASLMEPTLQLIVWLLLCLPMVAFFEFSDVSSLPLIV